jgi:hypothetical protein
MIVVRQPVHHSGSKSQEDVPLPVLTRAGLEVSSNRPGGLGVTQAAKMFLNVDGGYAVIHRVVSKAVAGHDQRGSGCFWFKRFRIIAARRAMTSASVVRSSLRNRAA